MNLFPKVLKKLAVPEDVAYSARFFLTSLADHRYMGVYLIQCHGGFVPEGKDFVVGFLGMSAK